MKLHRPFYPLLFLLTITLLSPFAFANEKFDVLGQKELPNERGIFQHLQFKLDENIEVYAATLNSTYQARLYQQEEKNHFFAKSMSDLSRSENFLLAVNGGFYTPNFQPAGLFVYHGKVLKTFKKSRILTSCIAITSDKKLVLNANKEACLHAYHAMQTGPLMISHGNINSSLKSAEDRTTALKSFFSNNRRTILAESSDAKLVVMIASSATLYEMALLLKNYPEAFGVKNIVTAFALDGGSSTGMYIRFKNSPFYYPEMLWVKTLVFFN